MCGILALLYKITTEKSMICEEILDTAKEYLSKRGPETRKTLRNKKGIFDFYRLAINDLSDIGCQPFQDEKEDIILMCNGEIYNHKFLREQFKLPCVSNSDCEVILHLYKLFGFQQTIQLLDGIFAIILVDRDTVYITRDRVGVKPLFHGQTENSHIFCSLPNCLIPACKETVYEISPDTIMTLNLTTGSISTQSLFSIQKISYAQEYPLEVIRNTLLNSVKKRLVSDRPIGCLLSGGLDSSLIASILCRELGPKNVRTYSIGLEGSTDLAYAKKVANFLGTCHREFVIDVDTALKAIPDVIKCIGNYDITTVRASVWMYLLGKGISEISDDKVIFSGEGSDELFQGYLYFHNAPSAEIADEESLRLVKNLHKYDVCRFERCISAWGLEPREPFLDKELINLVFTTFPSQKIPWAGIEKWSLRKAFDFPDTPYLPSEVLWRRKEGLSDGTSSLEIPWYQHIANYVEKIIPDYLYDPKFPSKEAQYYHMIFRNIFPGYDPEIPYWLPKWSGDLKNPSGRLIKAFSESPPT